MRAVTGFALLSAAAANRNAVGQTPIMGWSGCEPTPSPPAFPQKLRGACAADNAFMQNSGHCDKAGAGGYNETTFVQTAEALKRNGLADLGYVCPLHHPTPTPPEPLPTCSRAPALSFTPLPCPSAAPHGERTRVRRPQPRRVRTAPSRPNSPATPRSGLIPRVREAAGSRRSAPRPAS